MSKPGTPQKPRVFTAKQIKRRKRLRRELNRERAIGVKLARESR